MTVEQFETALGQFGETLMSQLDQDLLLIGGELVNELKGLAPVDSGALQNSIQAVVQDNQLKIEMLYYGMFQNFGVSGTKDGLGIPVSEGILPRPTSEPTYSFGIRTKGLKPQTFFDTIALSNRIAQRLDEIIQPRLNNI